MSRTEQSLKNIKFSSITLVISILLNFISRKVFIDCLGTDIVGLSSTLLNILGFLNLAELGLTSAIAGMLYVPLYSSDRSKVVDIISIFGYLYRIIGIVILLGGIIISFFLGYLFKDTNIPLSYIVAGYYTYLSVSLIGYFISYKQTLLVADQCEYIVTAYTYLAQVLKLIVQICALRYLECGYIIWLLIELIFGLGYGLLINKKVLKRYPWLNSSYNRGKIVRKQYSSLFITIKQVIPHNFAAFVQNQSSNILIYAFSSLSAVTIYTNYTMILVRSVQVLNLCMRGMTASFGNLIAEGNMKNTLGVFYQFQSVFLIIAGTLCITCYFQIDAFINVWLGNGFLLQKWILILMLYVMYVSIIRLPVNYFIGGFVLYKDIWAPITEAIINIVVAIIAGHYLGIGGVVIGSVVSLTLIIVLWKPLFLFSHGFNRSSLSYWCNLAKGITISFIVWLFIQSFRSSLIILSETSFFAFFVNSFVIFLLSFLMISLLHYLFDVHFRHFMIRIKVLI